MRHLFFLILILFSTSLNANVLNDLDVVNGVVPGCAVGIVKGGELVFEQYKGYSSLKYETVINQNTIFNIGSISKHLTAAVFYRLEMNGILNRNDSLNKYYPNGPDWFSTVKLGHLISHESGIPDYSNDYEFSMALIEILGDELIYKALAGLNLSSGEFVNLLLAGLSEMPEPNFSPGTKASYSNTGYVLLADIIKLQSGKEFNELIQELILRPYGLSETKVHDVGSEDLKWLATGYGTVSPAGNQRQVIKSHGDTGVLTTLRDFSKWVMVLNGADELSSDWNGFLVDATDKESSMLDGTLYQNGLEISSYKGLVYSHSGYSTDGMASTFWISPKNDIGYIKLCNFGFSTKPSKFEVFKYLDGLVE